ncbi:MAG TPA: DUF2062 domain-containing protein, partial [Flavobacteriales bacterium]|nr:DUF2062 domain-containing protein [Flavobacteriales bacterium]
TRISILNTWLVTLALLWYWPKRMILGGGLWKLMRAELVRPAESAWRKALSIGFGLFMGIVPIWGFQLLVGIPLAVLFRLNRVLFIAAANISIPPMIPLILFVSYLAGAPFMGEAAVHPELGSSLTLDSVHQHLKQYLIGSVVFAVCAGVVGTLITYGVLRVAHARRKVA